MRARKYRYQKYGRDYEIYSRTRKATSDLSSPQWKEPRYGMLPETYTVALGLARKNLSIRKGVWSVTQVYLKKKSSQDHW